MLFTRLLATPPLIGIWRILLDPNTDPLIIDANWNILRASHTDVNLGSEKWIPSYYRTVEEAVDIFKGHPFSDNHCFFLPFFNRYLRHRSYGRDLEDDDHCITEAVLGACEAILNQVTDSELAMTPLSEFVQSEYSDEILFIEEVVINLMEKEEALSEAVDSEPGAPMEVQMDLPRFFRFTDEEVDQINLRLGGRPLRVIIDLDESIWSLRGQGVILRNFLEEFSAGLAALKASGINVSIGIWSHAMSCMQSFIPTSLREVCDFTIFREQLKGLGYWGSGDAQPIPPKDIRWEGLVGDGPLCHPEQFYFFMDDRIQNCTSRVGFYHLPVFRADLPEVVMEDRELLNALTTLNEALLSLSKAPRSLVPNLLSGDRPWWEFLRGGAVSI